jgi:hypothetical protein
MGSKNDNDDVHMYLTEKYQDFVGARLGQLSISNTTF